MYYFLFRWPHCTSPATPTLNTTGLDRQELRWTSDAIRTSDPICQDHVPTETSLVSHEININININIKKLDYSLPDG